MTALVRRRFRHSAAISEDPGKEVLESLARTLHAYFSTSNSCRLGSQAFGVVPL